MTTAIPNTAPAIAGPPQLTTRHTAAMPPRTEVADSPAHLRRLRCAVRATLTLGVAASVAANIPHAHPNRISHIIAVGPPLALLLTVELISRAPTHRRSLVIMRLIAATTAVAGIAAWVSYWHMVGVAARYGETGAASYLLPLSVDGLVIVAGVSLIEITGRRRNHQQHAGQQPRPAITPPSQPAANPGPPQDSDTATGESTTATGSPAAQCPHADTTGRLPPARLRRTATRTPPPPGGHAEPTTPERSCTRRRHCWLTQAAPGP